jgi:hypothetical protein
MDDSDNDIGLKSETGLDNHEDIGLDDEIGLEDI